jgi:hypothetical protein
VLIRTQEEIVGVWTEASYAEYLEHVKELAVNIPYHRHGRSNMHHITLLHQQLLRLGTYGLDDRIGEQLLLVEP